MTPSQIFVAIVRAGKEVLHSTVAPGTTVEAVFVKEGLAAADYRNWNLTDEEGDTLALTDELHNSTQIIAGPRVDGA